MKKFLILFPTLFLVFISACKDEQEPKPATRLILNVMKQNNSQAGQIISEPTSAIIYIWQADNRDFDIASSPDIYVGYAYDKNTNAYKTMRYGAIGSQMNEKLAVGRYFAYVLLPKSTSKGNLAYSYTYFDIKAGETLRLSKTFSHDVGTGEFESWEKNNGK